MCRIIVGLCICHPQGNKWHKLESFEGGNKGNRYKSKDQVEEREIQSYR